MEAGVPLRRRQLVERLRSGGIADELVLGALARVPREIFVPPHFHGQAYEDFALEIGHGQSISQPSVVARMLELLHLQEGDRVLEIGSGSGYQTAILSELVRFVFSVERVPLLAEQARERLLRLGYANVSIQVMDGTLGWRAFAPFDAIVVSAGAPVIPQSLVEQLCADGRMVIPLGDRRCQELVLLKRGADGEKTSRHGPAAFVPLLGRQGFPEGS